MSDHSAGPDVQCVRLEKSVDFSSSSSAAEKTISQFGFQPVQAEASSHQVQGKQRDGQGIEREQMGKRDETTWSVSETAVPVEESILSS